MKLKKLLFSGLIGLCFIPNAYALTKNETVYTKLNTDGTVLSTTVTNELLSTKKEEIIDESSLREVLNISGDEKLEVLGKTMKWQSDGKAIFYQGKTDIDPEIETSVLYYFDGKKVEPKDILGREGDIEIVYTFKNTMSNEVMVNGKKEKLYTPFVVTLGTMLDATNVNEVEISSGKVVSNGKKYMVVALATPGLYESFGIENLKELNTITLKYHTTKFSLSQVYFVMTPKLLEKNDIAFLKELDTISNKIDLLQTSMNQIEEGTDSLKNGTTDLLSGATTLESSLGKVLTAVDSLKNGSTSLENGLTQIATSLSETKTSLATLGLENISLLQSGTTTAITELETVNASIEQTYLTYQLGTLTKEQILALPYDAATLTNLVTVKQTYEANTKLLTVLKGNYQVVSAVMQMSSKLDELEAGINALKDGATRMNSGIDSLKSAIAQIYQGSKTLKNGVGTLKKGTQTLQTGVHKLNQEGIGTIVQYKNKLKNYASKAEALVDLSAEYQGFASENSTNTTFVYTISSLKK